MSDIKVTPPEPRDRNGTEPAPRLPRRAADGRHGAERRELTKDAKYQNCAQKAHGAFAADGEGTGSNGSGHSRRSTDR